MLALRCLSLPIISVRPGISTGTSLRIWGSPAADVAEGVAAGVVGVVGVAAVR